MAIDIREGFQIECINCGRCIDACRTVMSRHDYPQGLIAYRFGSNAATGFRIGNKTIALSAVALLLTAIVITATGNRTESAFAVQRTPSVNNRTLPDGTTIEAWKAIIGNRSNQEALFTITAFTVAGTQLELLGPTAGLRIPPNENHTASFFIKLPPASAPAALELRLLRDRKMVAKTVVTP
jgi:polyferredoxin